MQVVEVRDLSGPNLFGMEPLIKLEVEVEDGSTEAEFETVEATIAALHEALDLPVPRIERHRLDQPRHFAFTFPWTYETAAVGIARQAVELGQDALAEDQVSRLRAALERDIQQQNHPEWIRDDERSLPVVGITGTNGKTTTTRLLSHILMSSGRRVGWSSSSGVYIQGENVLEGDYSGPSGARRVIREPGLDIGVLETARGGLLLRGLPYESNDVSIFLNVSADHLSLQGVEKIETLAEVKSVVVRATNVEGSVVLNADDPLVWRTRNEVRAPVIAVTRNPDHPDLPSHLETGGEAIVCAEGMLRLRAQQGERSIVSLDDLPYTYQGTAGFMVENVLAATAAAHALGLTSDEIGTGLRSFRSNSTLNPGRLNVYDCGGVSVVVDYAHNADGLEELLRFGRNLSRNEGKIHAVVGTAGDRRDDDFRDLGAIAGSSADWVYLKDTPEYLRDRARGDMQELMFQGMQGAETTERLAGKFDAEFTAVVAALENAAKGDTILIMCQSDLGLIAAELQRRGAVEL